MDLHIKVTGGLMVALAMFHLAFPKYFDWKKDLEGLTLMNRQMMYINTFFIGLILLLMGLLCISSSQEIIHTAFGKTVALGMGLFWSVRLLVQFFGYSPDLWRGKTFETAIHVCFSFLWIYFSGVFFCVWSVS